MHFANRVLQCTGVGSLHTCIKSKSFMCVLKSAVQTCKLDLKQYLQEDLIANCVLSEPKSEAYIVLNRPLGRRKRFSKCSCHRS